MVHATCAALHCLSSSHTNKDLKFHQFPHDVERRKIWITACKRSDVIDKDWDFFKHKYVCSFHFQKCMYSKKDRLKKSAIPTLHLSEKPLQYDSSTQTVESIQYVNQSENESILYVMPNVEKSSTTTKTQTEDSIPYDIKHVKLKEEIITHKKVKESESVEQDVEIKTENDDENSELAAFEEDVEMKTEIVENEIIPLLKSTQSLQSVDLEITKDDGTLSTQDKDLLHEINQGLPATIVNRISTNPINTSTMPILKRKMDGSIQTDRVIVLSRNADGSEGSINPEECTCNRNDYVDMTRPQFYRACSKFLSANFANTVRIQMHLDGSEASSSGTVKAGAAECVEEPPAERGRVVTPDVLIAGTLSEKPLQHDSFTQTVESIQYVSQQSENVVSILYVMPNVEKNSTTTYTQTEYSLPYDINHVNIKEKIITHTKIKEFESVKQDVEMKTENDDHDDENSDLGPFEEDEEMKIEIVENEILPSVQSSQSLQSVDLEITKDDGTFSTQAKNLLQEIVQGTATIVNRTSTNPLNTSKMPILKRKMDGSIQTDRVIVLSSDADGSEGSVNPEECTCNRNVYMDTMTRLQFYKACSKFLSAKFAMTVRKQMHSDDFTKQGGNKLVIAGTETADSAEADLYAVHRVEASAAVSAADCARSTPLTELGMNLNPEGPTLITSTVELTNTPQLSIRPKQELKQCIHVMPLERAVACNLDKEDWDVTGNDHYDHVKQGVSELSPPGSLQGTPRSCRTPVSKVFSGVTRKRKRKKVRLFTASLAEGSEFDSDIEFKFDLDEITSSGDMARNIPDDDDLDESVSQIVNSSERAMDDAIDQLVGMPSDFNWRADFDTFQGVREDFSGPTPGPIEDYDTPYDAFTAIWSNDIMDHIVIETNRYAQQVIDEKTKAGTLQQSSRLRRWTITDKDEVYMFFALHMLMGLDQRITQHEFWKTTGYLEMPKFRTLMKYRRFLLLNRVFHFEDNSGANQDLAQSTGIVLPAKLRKIAPIVGHLNNKFSNLYNLHADTTIDESLTKGRLSWVQAIRSKTAWDGIKSYELCDSITGYLYKFEIYTGKNSKQGHFESLSEALAEKSTQVVMDLLTGLETRGHCITMDNFYNSPALARHLKSLGFDCLGTLRPNRKNVPLEIKNLPKNVAKGTTIARHCGDVSCIAWKDTKMVTMISTYHTSEMYIDCKAGQELVKPVIIRDYNYKMEGVNLNDQKTLMYFFERKKRKRCLKWYMKIFLRLLNVSVRNAFILLSHSLKRRGMPFPTDRDFREELANSLLANRPRIAAEISSGDRRPEEISAPIQEKYTRLRKDIIHVPKYHANDADRWRCYICHRRGIQKMVYSSCVTCNEFICFEGCWSDWHSLQNLPSVSNVSCRKRKRCA